MPDEETEPSFVSEFLSQPAVRWIGFALLLVAAVVANWRFAQGLLTGETSPPFGSRIVQLAANRPLFIGLVIARGVFALVCDALAFVAIRDKIRARITRRPAA